MIVLSIVILSVDTLPGLSPSARRSLHVSETIITILFTVEYILRVATAPKKLGYILSFYGIVDLLAILPFYLTAAGVDLYILRIVRMFRVLRVLKLLRYNEALKRFGKALTLAKEEIAVYSLATGMMLYLAAAGIYYFEHEAQPEAFGSIFHCLWVGRGNTHNGRVRRRVPRHRRRESVHIPGTDVRARDRRGAGGARLRRPIANPPGRERARATQETNEVE